MNDRDEQIYAQARRIQDLEEQNLKLIEKIVEIKVDPLTVPRKARKEEAANQFALPPLVEEAIEAMALPGSTLDLRLRKFARTSLANGDTDPEEVAEAILQGSEAFKDEDW